MVRGEETCCCSAGLYTQFPYLVLSTLYHIDSIVQMSRCIPSGGSYKTPILQLYQHIPPDASLENSSRRV